MNKQPSRTGKDKKTGKETKEKSTKSTEKQITTLCEIVPGKFNENDWNILLDTDESQDYAFEIIEEIFDNATKIIYEKYLDKQTIPFTTNEAKKAILHIIEWQFLTKDKNDDKTEIFIQDSEPDSCIIDSWAQGYVQTFELEPIQTEKNETNLNENQFLNQLNKIIDDPSSSENDQQLDREKTREEFKSALNQTKSTTTHVAKLKKTKIFLNDSNNKKIDFNQLEEEELLKKKTNPRVKRIDPEIKKIDESIAKAPLACQTTLKSLLSRPESRKEIEIDLDGNIKYMNKLDFDKLPNQRVRARFTINDNQKVENYESMRRSKVSMVSSELNEKAKRNLYDDDDLVLEPAPGVTFTLQNSIRTGPKRQLVPSRQQTLYEKSELYLKPVKQLERTDLETRRSLNEILDGYPLLAKPDPYNQLRRIPPINASASVN